jgi:hypothetical protein
MQTHDAICSHPIGNLTSNNNACLHGLLYAIPATAMFTIGTQLQPPCLHPARPLLFKVPRYVAGNCSGSLALRPCFDQALCNLVLRTRPICMHVLTCVRLQLQRITHVARLHGKDDKLRASLPIQQLLYSPAIVHSPGGVDKFLANVTLSSPW